MATLARASASVASGSGRRTPNPSTGLARQMARKPVRVPSPRFSGAGGVRGTVSEDARGASAPARAAEGGADVPSGGGGPKKRRGKNRRRAPRKNDEASDDAFSSSSDAAALPNAAGVDPDAATVARFMGTLDESDAGADGLGGATGAASEAETAADPPPPSRGGAAARPSKKRPPRALAPPPESGGDPDLAFLYDADAVRSISMCAGDEPPDVNDARVVARCDEVLRARRSMDDVSAAVREMTAAGVAPAESTYIAIMLVCRDTAVGPARAVEVYDAMKLAGVAPTPRSFELAMTCAIRARKPEDALRLWEDAVRGPDAARLRLRPRTFTALLKCVSECDFGRKRGAKARLIRTCRLFEETLSSNAPGAVPPPAAFHVLISAAARARQPDLAARAFEEMRAAGISPSRETYETALAAVAAGGLVDQALDVFAAMRRDGFAPRKTTYNSLLEACATAPQPRVEQAFEIFHRMADEGRVAPNARTFALLIDAAARANMPRFAFDAFDAARAARVDVPLSVYNRLIRAAGGDGAEPFDDGLDAVADAIASRAIVSADRSSHAPSRFRNASGGVAVARALLAEVRDNTPLEPDAYTFGCVLGACAAAAAAGDPDAADAARATCEEMRAANVPHNRATRHALIATLGRAGLWREALREYVDMKRGGGGGRGDETEHAERRDSGPSRETYGVVFDALLSPGGAEAAIAAVALEPGGGETFIRGARAAAARAVFRDGVDAGVFEDPRRPSGRSKRRRASVSDEDLFDEAYENALRNGRRVDGADADPPLRVNHVHMTRAEAVVATLVLLESFADLGGTRRATNETNARDEKLPGGLFIGEGPGTKGNAQRRTLAVESVLRAASVPCETVEDPRAYVVGVTQRGLRGWAERSSKFETLDLSAPSQALDARLDELEARDAEAPAKSATTLLGG